MPCGRIVGNFRFRMAVPSTEDMWEPAGQPLIIVGGHALDYALTISRVTSNASAIAATALMVAREDIIVGIEPASGEWSRTQGTTHHVTDLALVKDKFFALPGVLAKLASAGPPGYIAGHLSVILQSCGTMIGMRSIEVSPNQTTPQVQFFPIGRVPASGGDKLRAAIVTNAANDIEYRFHGRGVNDPDAPGSWRPIGTWTPIPNGNSAICTPDTSISDLVLGNHLIECALALRMKSAGANPTGFLRVAAGLSYA